MAFRTNLLPGTTYTRHAYDDLVATYPGIGLTAIDYGPDSGEGTSEERRIYGLTTGPLTGKPVIMLQAGIHGREWRSVWHAQWIAQLLGDPSKAGAFRPAIERLKSRFVFHIIPALIPYGYENQSQGNANGVDCNRNFDYNWEASDTPYGSLTKGEEPFDQVESRLSRDLVLQHKPLLFVDMHSRLANNVWLSRARGDVREYYPLLDDLEDTYNISAGAWDAASPVDRLQLTNGSIVAGARSWATDQLSSFGRRMISCLIEGGDNWPDELNSSQVATTFFLLCLYADTYWFGQKQARYKL